MVSGIIVLWSAPMRRFLPLLPLVPLAACVAPQPAPAPVPVARPAPPPPAPVAQDWRDLPLAAGAWAYRADEAGSSAMFGMAGAEASLILRCDLASRTVTLSWIGTPIDGGVPTTITTSHGIANYRAAAVAGAAGRIGVSLPAGDPFLDRIAFSRGRFVIGGAAAAGPGERLVVPAWAEPARAIEDCRK